MSGIDKTKLSWQMADMGQRCWPRREYRGQCDQVNAFIFKAWDNGGGVPRLGCGGSAQLNWTIAVAVVDLRRQATGKNIPGKRTRWLVLRAYCGL